MKKIICLSLALFATQAIAQVAQVNIWSPHPGRAAETMQNASEAKAIHEKLGANIGISVDQMGDLHYVATFESWEAYGKFQAASMASEEWQQWWQGVTSDPSAELMEVYFLNQPVVAEEKPVTMVFSWDVAPGRTAEFIERAQQAVPIHNRLGASAGINVDDVGDVHYALSYDSWEAWGRFTAAAAADKEWNEFLAANTDAIGELVKVWRINNMPD